MSQKQYKVKPVLVIHDAYLRSPIYWHQFLKLWSSNGCVAIWAWLRSAQQVVSGFAYGLLFIAKIGAAYLLESISSFSWRVGNLLTSTGLQRPKSESLRCPLLSKSRLSGFISLNTADTASRFDQRTALSKHRTCHCERDEERGWLAE